MFAGDDRPGGYKSFARRAKHDILFGGLPHLLLETLLELLAFFNDRVETLGHNFIIILLEGSLALV